MQNISKEDDVPGVVRGSGSAAADDPHITGGEEVAFGMSRLIESVPYPATKEDIMDYASDQGAEEVVLDMLEQLPDTTYNTPADVSQALGENSQIMGP